MPPVSGQQQQQPPQQYMRNSGGAGRGSVQQRRDLGPTNNGRGQGQQDGGGGGRPPVSPRNVAPARQGGGRSGRKAQRERNMAYQKIGMDGATSASAANRRPESFHQKSPRTLQRRSNQRNAMLAEQSTEAQLAFSRKARSVDWQPKTMKEYRRLQPKEYIELGKLPADLNSPQLIKKVRCCCCCCCCCCVIFFCAKKLKSTSHSLCSLFYHFFFDV